MFRSKRTFSATTPIETVIEHNYKQSKGETNIGTNSINNGLKDDHMENGNIPASWREKRVPVVSDKIDPQPLVDGQKYLRIVSWNVNGLKALITNNLSVLHNLVNKHKPDILCLQETKIQEQMVDEYKDLLPDYCSYWNCCTVKKGYSGTAIFINKHSVDHSSVQLKKTHTLNQTKLTEYWNKTTTNPITSNEITIHKSLPATKNIQALQVFTDIPADQPDLNQEGRMIVMETNLFYLLNCYVPNAGDKLRRLNYRIEVWDPFLREYIQELQKQKPVILTGDLNVGHRDDDTYNASWKFTKKKACLTPEERESFSKLLDCCGLEDAFRFYYPYAKGQFSYWSQRTLAREVNHGLRLDYIVASKELFPPKLTDEISNPSVHVKEETSDTENGFDIHDSSKAVRAVVNITTKTPWIYDSYYLDKETIGCSDHCPVILLLQIA